MADMSKVVGVDPEVPGMRPRRNATGDFEQLHQFCDSGENEPCALTRQPRAHHKVILRTRSCLHGRRAEARVFGDETMNLNVIKQHLFEVVCGLVIVAALSTYFLWNSWDNNTKDAAGVRDGKVTSLQNIIKDKIPMPGLDATKRDNVIVGPLPGDSADPREKKKGSAVELRRQIFESLNNSARQIAESETRGNSQNKMKLVAVPRFSAAGV